METNYSINKPGVILLAAGSSSRLGKPKQLLPYKGRNFLQHILSVIQETKLDAIVVVIGANASLIKKELDNGNIIIAENEEWQEGIASSIRTGIKLLQNNFPDCDAALILLVDQPYISSSLLNNLLERQKQSGKPIAACEYEHITGVPALFHQSLFPELLNLKGDKGAGKIIQQRIEDVVTISFPLGGIDIDTEEDYNQLKENERTNLP